MAIFTRRNALIGWWFIQSHRIARKILKVRRAYRRQRKRSTLVALAAASLAGVLAFGRGRRSED